MWVGVRRADPSDGSSPWIWAQDGSNITSYVGDNTSRFCAVFIAGSDRLYPLHCINQPKKEFMCELGPL